MGLGELFRDNGLSLADIGFVKLNVLFPVMLALAHASVAAWVGSGAAAAAVGMMPVDAKALPWFVAAVVPLWAVALSVVALMALAACAPRGYESQRGRAQKAPGMTERLKIPSWIERVQFAQYNTWEGAIAATGAFVCADKVGIPEGLFAELAALFLLLRLFYPVPYALDVDLIRTQVWLTGLYATAMVAFAALFPDTIIPLL